MKTEIIFPMDRQQRVGLTAQLLMLVGELLLTCSSTRQSGKERISSKSEDSTQAPRLALVVVELIES
jgi:hypothetical protein